MALCHCVSVTLCHSETVSLSLFRPNRIITPFNWEIIINCNSRCDTAADISSYTVSYFPGNSGSAGKRSKVEPMDIEAADIKSSTNGNATDCPGENMRYRNSELFYYPVSHFECMIVQLQTVCPREKCHLILSAQNATIVHDFAIHGVFVWDNRCHGDSPVVECRVCNSERLGSNPGLSSWI